jgi:predicted nucleotidyltransferase
MIPDIKPDHLSIVRSILRQYLPQNAQIWVFGSRAKATTKTYADLDLAFDLGQKMSLDLTLDLAIKFQESDLPYKVDMVDMVTVDSEFRQIIEAEMVPLLL